MAHGRQFGYALLVMAALTGAIGFAIVYHYASLERPMKRFAILTDAGSTQTRSGLFTIDLDVPRLTDWIDSSLEESGKDEKRHMPLDSLIQVQQVSTCINGPPVASLKSIEGAEALVSKCVGKFSQKIKRLDFISSTDADSGMLEDQLEEEEQQSSEGFEQRSALAQHRVNSVTHLHLGATAGMRALERINKTRANEKISWLELAINQSDSSSTPNGGPHINKGYVGILSGSDEASLGWISVNFVSGQLEAKGGDSGVEMEAKDPSSSSYAIPTENLLTSESAKRALNSVGTLELGGASAQMAYETSSELEVDSKMETRKIDLFNARYQVATRSDLCLGMSQAALRVSYVLLRDLYSSTATSPAARARSFLELDSPCLQKAARSSYSSAEIGEILRAPCLLASELDEYADAFKRFLALKSIIRLVGTGNTSQCDALLTNLVDPLRCSKYFALCPAGPNEHRPPPGMPFVTISGYNKALEVLKLEEKKPSLTSAVSSSTDKLIRDKLGGGAVDHMDFVEETRKFCSIDVSEFPIKFPRMSRAYYALNCLQLVYINKLLIEMYRFDPTTSWNEIRFLVFATYEQDKGESVDKKQPVGTSNKNDIGWTLGLLLNATSQQLADPSSDIFYHHGSSVGFVLKVTLLLMIACVLLAISLLVFALIIVRRKHRGGAYINHSYCSTEPTGSVVKIA